MPYAVGNPPWHARFAVVALGTRGDVQPLALLAWQLKHQAKHAREVTIVTHLTHKEWLEDLLLIPDYSTPAINTLYVDSKPASVWHSSPKAAQTGNAAIPAPAAAGPQARLRQQLVQHCCTALHTHISALAGQSRHQQQSTEPPQQQQAWQQRQPQALPHQLHEEQQQQQQPNQQPLQHEAKQQQQQQQSLPQPIVEDQVRGNAPLQPQQQQQQGQPQQSSERHQQATHPQQLVKQNYQQEQPMQAYQQQRQQQQQCRLLLFNLFALEAYHISEALQVPCMVVQPYLIPYPMPTGFQRRLNQAAPQLGHALQDAAHHGSTVSWKDVSHWMWPLFTERWGGWRQDCLGLQALPLLQAWQEGWQGCTYRTLTPSISSIMEHGSASLCTNSSSSSSSHDSPRSSKRARMQNSDVGGFSMHRNGGHLLKAGQGISQASVATLPAAVPVLYGLSSSVVPKPGFWPTVVHMTGFWLVQDMHQQQMRRQPRCKLASAGCPGTQQQQQLAKRKEGPELIQRQRQQHQLAAAGSSCCLPPQLQAFLDSNETGPLLYVQPQHQRQQDVQPGQQQQLQQQQHHCSGSGTGSLLVDFGSMGCLGLLTDATLLVQVVAKALQLLDWHGVLMTNGWTGLTDAHAALNPVGQQRLYLQTKALHCHHLLLESVDVVLHHGGSGTTAVALAAGVPQLICPLQYDQFYWAERMADLGCSPDPPVSAELLLPQYQQHGMVAVDRPSVGRTASQQRELAATMAGQDEQMQQWQPQERDDHTLLLQGEGWQQQRFEAAVEGGGAYLASQVLAARAQHMLDISASLKMEVACEDGLVNAANAVVRHLQSVYRIPP